MADKKVDVGKLNTFEMNCYCRMIEICWRDKLANEKIKSNLKRNNIVMDETNLRTLLTFGHIC